MLPEAWKDRQQGADGYPYINKMDWYLIAGGGEENYG